MNKKQLRFINDILKPWDKLNRLLAQPNVYEPGINDVVRMSTNLAIAINHWRELIDADKKSIIEACNSYKIMGDIADMVKHRSLRDKSRENEVYVTSTFEFREDEELIKFLRSVIVVEYKKSLKYDFIVESANAINFWIDYCDLGISKERIILTCESSFQKDLILYYDSDKCIQMDSTRFQVFKKNVDNQLIPCDPKNVNIGIVKITKKQLKLEQKVYRYWCFIK